MVFNKLASVLRRLFSCGHRSDCKTSIPKIYPDNSAAELRQLHVDNQNIFQITLIQGTQEIKVDLVTVYRRAPVLSSIILETEPLCLPFSLPCENIDFDALKVIVDSWYDPSAPVDWASEDIFHTADWMNDISTKKGCYAFYRTKIDAGCSDDQLMHILSIAARHDSDPSLQQKCFSHLNTKPRDMAKTLKTHNLFAHYMVQYVTNNAWNSRAAEQWLPEMTMKPSPLQEDQIQAEMVRAILRPGSVAPIQYSDKGVRIATKILIRQHPFQYILQQVHPKIEELLVSGLKEELCTD